MNLKVIGQNLLVKVIPEEEKGIVSGEEVNIIKGSVLSVGSAVNPINHYTATQTLYGNSITLEIKHNDVVWFNKFDAINLPFDEELFVVDKEDIIVIEEDE